MWSSWSPSCWPPCPWLGRPSPSEREEGRRCGNGGGGRVSGLSPPLSPVSPPGTSTPPASPSLYLPRPSPLLTLSLTPLFFHHQYLQARLLPTLLSSIHHTSVAPKNSFFGSRILHTCLAQGHRAPPPAVAILIAVEAGVELATLHQPSCIVVLAPLVSHILSLPPILLVFWCGCFHG